jgi:hypothetical protein
MTTIYIIPIEPIDSRYTAQWYHNIPLIISDQVAALGLDTKVVTIDGEQVANTAQAGAFLDFASTNVYKASQVQRISMMFNQGVIQPHDKFLVTDAWNFAITAIKYMSDLLDIPVQIYSIWHAGAYDPSDILGYRMQKPWPHHQERAWFHCSDFNYFATDFHKNMFLKNLSIEPEYHQRAVRSGQPHTPIIDQCAQYFDQPKKNQMIWPHRYNADKQPEIAEDLALVIPTVITQKLNLAKAEFYQTLGTSAVMFSCSLHENLGISMMEGVLAGVIPVMPDRCSYSEMYLDEFLYPSAWTETLDAYEQHRQDILEFIQERVQNYSKYVPALKKQRDILVQHYLTPSVMVDQLLAQS